MEQVSRVSQWHLAAPFEGATTLNHLIFFSITILLLHFAVTSIVFQKSLNAPGFRKLPALWPHSLPFVGSLDLMLSYLLNSPMTFFEENKIFRLKQPVRVKLFGKQLFLVQGTANISDVFKNSWTSTSLFLHQFSLRHAFGMKEQALRLYDQDDSGSNPKPSPGSTVAAHNRIDYRSYQTITQLLSGSGFKPLSERFERSVTARFRRYPIDQEWKDIDLLKVFETEVSAASTDALCGQHLLRRSPDFLEVLWELDRDLGVLFKGTPRFLAPRVYRRRDTLLAAIKDWHAFARESFHPGAVDSNGDDPFWGSRFFRDRHRIFLEMDGMDHDAIASEDFGAIWASTRNSVMASFWAVLEIFSDPALLARVRQEVERCQYFPSSAQSPSDNTNGDSIEEDKAFDMDALLNSPLLQSIYAEVLRLRVHIYIVRVPQRFDLPIGAWAIPNGSTMLMCSTPAHMDPEAWDTGSAGEHPLDGFWADRFLRYGEAEANVCPTKNSSGEDTVGSDSCPANRKVRFTLKDNEGSWIPYGGGPRMCPGRHFAKREIILTAAIMVAFFDVEVLKDVRSLKMDMGGFGFGTLGVDGTVPIRIRRRQQASS